VDLRMESMCMPLQLLPCRLTEACVKTRRLDMI
jgi:hypothetical protein